MGSFATNDQVLQPIGLTIGGATTRTFTATATDVDAIINQVPRKLQSAALGATAARTTDSVTGHAAPTLKTGQSFAVLITMGFTGSGGAREVHQLFSVPGNVGSGGVSLPVHVADGHVAVGYMLFRNDGSADWTYGTSNWGAATTVKRKAFDVSELPAEADWADSTFN